MTNKETNETNCNNFLNQLKTIAPQNTLDVSEEKIVETTRNYIIETIKNLALKEYKDIKSSIAKKAQKGEFKILPNGKKQITYSPRFHFSFYLPEILRANLQDVHVEQLTDATCNIDKTSFRLHTLPTIKTTQKKSANFWDILLNKNPQIKTIKYEGYTLICLKEFYKLANADGLIMNTYYKIRCSDNQDTLLFDCNGKFVKVAYSKNNKSIQEILNYYFGVYDDRCTKLEFVAEFD